jgi:peptidoglycan-associated lipoprotein
MQQRHVLVPLGLLALSAVSCRKTPPAVEPIPVETPAPPPPPPAPIPPPPPSETGSEIKPEYHAVLDRKGEIMRANPALRIRISGHADERGSDEYNLVLGNQRALAAKAYLQGRGIDASRIEVTSYGEEHPLERASTEEAWAQNRRDEFEIIAGGNQLVRPR